MSQDEIIFNLLGYYLSNETLVYLSLCLEQCATIGRMGIFVTAAGCSISFANFAQLIKNLGAL